MVVTSLDPLSVSINLLITFVTRMLNFTLLSVERETASRRNHPSFGSRESSVLTS